MSTRSKPKTKPIVHLTPGEIILPQHAITQELRRVLDQAFANAGLDPAKYRVAAEPNLLSK